MSDRRWIRLSHASLLCAVLAWVLLLLVFTLDRNAVGFYSLSVEARDFLTATHFALWLLSATGAIVGALLVRRRVPRPRPGALLWQPRLTLVLAIPALVLPVVGFGLLLVYAGGMRC